MSDEQKRILEQQLWNLDNARRGKMEADEFISRGEANRPDLDKLIEVYLEEFGLVFKTTDI